MLQHTSVLAFGIALDVLELLREHGCLLEENERGWLVRYPEGTNCEEFFPRAHDTHSQIILPDGYIFEEQYVSTSSTSILRYPIETIKGEKYEPQASQPKNV